MEKKGLDYALLKLRDDLTKDKPSDAFDFYAPKLKERWKRDKKIKTEGGEVTVIVPNDNEEHEDDDNVVEVRPTPEIRQSKQMQAKLAEIGAIMGFKIWVPRIDRGRVCELVQQNYHGAFLEDLPLSYHEAWTTFDAWSIWPTRTTTSSQNMKNRPKRLIR